MAAAHLAVVLLAVNGAAGLALILADDLSFILAADLSLVTVPSALATRLS